MNSANFNLRIVSVKLQIASAIEFVFLRKNFLTVRVGNAKNKGFVVVALTDAVVDDADYAGSFRRRAGFGVGTFEKKQEIEDVRVVVLGVSESVELNAVLNGFVRALFAGGIS